MFGMTRRDFVALLGGAGASWPLSTRAQQPMPVIGFLSSAAPGPYAAIVAAVRQGLRETGYVEGQNLTIEYRWADSQLDRCPRLRQTWSAARSPSFYRAAPCPRHLRQKQRRR
jgi:putative tryptophan/tyrosine transport system substrate-binding protein